MPPDPRRQLSTLIILAAFGMAVGRILSAELVLEPSLHRAPGETTPTKRAWPPTRPTPMPTFGSNDRPRWATVRSLVDEKTFVIGRRDPALKSETNKYGDSGITFEDGWGTVDKVMNPDTGEFYSTKPPLLSVLV